MTRCRESQQTFTTTVFLHISPDIIRVIRLSTFTATHNNYL